MYVSFPGHRYKYSTSIKAVTAQWSFDKERFKRTAKQAAINIRLSQLQSKAEQFFYASGDDPPTREEMKRAIFGDRSKSSDFYEHFNQFIDDRRRSGRFRNATIKVYNTTYKKLDAFNPKLKFEDINFEFFNSFTSWLYKSGFSSNYVNKIIGTLKAVLNDATEAGVNQNLAFRSKRFSAPKAPTESIYLTSEELKRIDSLTQLPPGEDNARRLFLIAAHTGLRYSDVIRLTPANIVKIKQRDYIRITNQKTRVQTIVPLKQIVIDLIADGFPRSIENQRMNQHLKTIAKKAGIDSPVTLSVHRGEVIDRVTKPKYMFVSSHTARRSFATNAYLAGVPTISIMAITGHKTERSFLSYIKIDPEVNARNIENHEFFK